MSKPMASGKKLLKSPVKKHHVASKTFAEHLLKSELEITGAISFIVVLAYFLGFPLARKCLLVSYRYGADAYAKGLDDLYFVAFWVVAFTFLRAAIMKYMFHPAARLLGINPFAKRQRLAEQGFIFTYYAIFWLLGMYIMYHSPHWFNTSQYWIDYPHVLITLKMKSYYLMQMAFWFQQLYTIHVEKRRKDHFAMVSHHFITITLLVSSYYTNFTRIGNAVLCCMDLADIFLSLAKILKYVNLTTVCDITFGLFAVTWPITRHLFFSLIVWATIVEPTKYLDMKWEPEKGKYFTPVTQKIYVVLFLLLNAIMIYWFSMIVRVITAVLRGKNAEDTRSDDEDDMASEAEEEIKQKKMGMNGKQD
ncbi:TLC domain-containing protein [Radiomyces spectabilis]|uniref:TLC domain-containing protein n=1 Tax=Radiomyces spectabilis TaxID=64574 RepID=UPI00221FFAF7|nr:TLC domain-containing protein [Radiomyces spectabilis]KAI8367502.1 TLC domain-containing protein [Radiomyces spectabilis]